MTIAAPKVDPATGYLIPTREQILRDFRKCTKLGGDAEFQFERVQRRWAACGYDLNELTVLFARRGAR